ncbi:MAG: TrmH family RNA methyltransferase [Planctomycetota bacterium]
MQEPVRSRSNAVVKLVREVRARKRDDLVVVEGERLVRDALARGPRVEALLAAEGAELDPALLARPELRRASTDVMQAVSGLVHGPGVLAVVEAPRWIPIAEFAFPAEALLLCVSGVADPGNLGALARSAEAAGACAIAVAPGGAHPFGDKALRGSMGSLLRLPVLRFESGDDVARTGLVSVVAATRDGVDHRAHDWRGNVAVWVTGETGSVVVEPPRDARAVTIAMSGAVESLNAACAATLLLFEARRART